MTVAENLPIVVGVDGSTPATAAARWAAAEAMLRGRPLRLVHTYSWPVAPAAVTAPSFVISEESLREAAEAVLSEALADVRQAVPGVPVAGRVIAGSASHVLLELSSTAGMVVVGHRGHGGFASLLLGSVAAHVVAHARCPVALVRPAAAGTDAPAVAADAPVVVGVDGSAISDGAVRVAFEEAELRGVAVHAVHAWDPPALPWRTDIRPLVRDEAELETAEAGRLRDWVHPWQEKHPQVPVEYQLTPRRPAGALLDASRTAALLVVGSRGHGTFTGLLLGSVSQQVIHHAAGPVLVVHPPAD
ncbi:MAG TPA: universal stress protein [Micromonosporaceae bacterium]|nr:universal stress protein [Micromonosporaceae bacterium]